MQAVVFCQFLAYLYEVAGKVVGDGAKGEASRASIGRSKGLHKALLPRSTGSVGDASPLPDFHRNGRSVVVDGALGSWYNSAHLDAIAGLMFMCSRS